MLDWVGDIDCEAESDWLEVAESVDTCEVVEDPLVLLVALAVCEKLIVVAWLVDCV